MHSFAPFSNLKLGTDVSVQVTKHLETEFFAPKERFPPYCRLWFIVRGAAIFEGLVLRFF